MSSACCRASVCVSLSSSGPTFRVSYRRTHETRAECRISTLKTGISRLRFLSLTFILIPPFHPSISFSLFNHLASRALSSRLFCNCFGGFVFIVVVGQRSFISKVYVSLSFSLYLSFSLPLSLFISLPLSLFSVSLSSGFLAVSWRRSSEARGQPLASPLTCWRRRATGPSPRSGGSARSATCCPSCATRGSPRSAGCVPRRACGKVRSLEYVFFYTSSLGCVFLSSSEFF